MSWEGVTAIASIVFFVVGSVTQICVLCFLAGKMIGRLDSAERRAAEFQISFERHMDSEDKNEAKMWEKIDVHGNLLSDHGARISNLEKIAS